MRYFILACALVISTMTYGITYISQITNNQNGTAVIAAKPAKQTGGDNLSFTAPNDLSPKQFNILKSAYHIAKTDGNPHPEKFQAIIMTETLACDNSKYKVAGKSERYYGCGQVKLKTAKAVLQKHPELWSYMQSREDDEIIANLILNDEFNLKIASKYFMMTNGGRVDDFAITAYNQGPTGAKNVDPSTFGYTKKVKENEKKIKRIIATSLKS